MCGQRFGTVHENGIKSPWAGCVERRSDNPNSPNAPRVRCVEGWHDRREPTGTSVAARQRPRMNRYPTLRDLGIWFPDLLSLTSLRDIRAWTNPPSSPTRLSVPPRSGRRPMALSVKTWAYNGAKYRERPATWRRKGAHRQDRRKPRRVPSHLRHWCSTHNGPRDPRRDLRMNSYDSRSPEA